MSERETTLKKVSGAAVAIAIATFCAVPSHAQTLSTGATVAAATPTLILQPVGAGTPRTYLKIQNVGLFSSGDATAWCTFATSPAAVTSSQLHAALVPNAAGAIAIAPVENIRPYKTELVFEGQNTPQGAVVCTSDGGSSGTGGAKLTITSLPQ